MEIHTLYFLLLVSENTFLDNLSGLSSAYNILTKNGIRYYIKNIFMNNVAGSIQMSKLHSFSYSDIKAGRGIATFIDRGIDHYVYGYAIMIKSIFKDNVALSRISTIFNI